MNLSKDRREAMSGPAVWLGCDLAEATDWLFPLENVHLDEIDAALAPFHRRAVPWQELSKESVPLRALSELLREIARVLEHGRGLAKITGLPVERYDVEDLKRLFYAIGLYLGTPLSQSVTGELMASITDEGPSAGETRGQFTTGSGQTFLSSRARVHSTGQLRFHTDRADVVALLAVSQGKSGGLSKVVSTQALHNAMLERRPDLLELLFQDYPRSRLGEEVANNADFYELPIFAVEEGRFTSHYSRTYIEAAQLNPAAPRLSKAQWEALDLLHELAEELCYKMFLAPGDVQLLNNHVIYHARDAYEDDREEGRLRLLYRLWLSMPGSRPLPKKHRVLWGAVEPGALRGGIRESDRLNGR